MSVFDFVIFLLASAAALDVWFKGSIFSMVRANLEESDGFLAELLTCRLCLSVHVTGIMTAWWFVTACMTPAWSAVLRVPVYALAMVGVMNYVQILSYGTFEFRKRFLNVEEKNGGEGKETI